MNQKLLVKPREQKASAVRADGSIPGVVYGPEFKSTAVTLPRKIFLDVLSITGESSLIDCTIEGKDEPVAVLVQEIQRDPVRGEIMHVDLRQVNLKEEIEADIALNFEGEAPAVKGENGTLITNMDTISVKCLPSELVAELLVSLESLETLEDTITVSDIKVPSTYEVLSNPDDVVAKVMPPRSEEEMAALDEDVSEDVEGVAVEGASEEEGEQTDEGEGSAENEQKEEEKTE
mgnify:CR=1 FL=1